MLMNVADDPHDFPSGGSFSGDRLNKVKPFAQRVFARKVFARQSFIDDHHTRRTHLVVRLECPPLQKRYSHCLKISGRAKIEVHRIDGFPWQRWGADREGDLRTVPSQWQSLGYTRTIDPRQAVDPLDHLLEESRPPFGVRILFLG